MGSATISFDFPRSKRIGSHLRMNSGTLTLSSSYATGGESANFEPYFRSVKQVVLADQDSGYIFEYDYTNKKVKAYYPVGAVAAHVHGAGNIAITTNVTNANTGDAVKLDVANSVLTAANAGSFSSTASGNTNSGGAISNAAGAEVAATTNMAGVSLHFVVYGTY